MVLSAAHVGCTIEKLIAVSFGVWLAMHHATAKHAMPATAQRITLAKHTGTRSVL